MDVTNITSASSGASQVNIGMTAQFKVMALADNAMEDAMAELLGSMDALISGLGQGLDMSV